MARAIETIAASNRDAELSSVSGWNSTGATIRFGAAGAETYTAYLAFPVELPAAAVIESAILELTPADDDHGLAVASVSALALLDGDLSSEPPGGTIEWTPIVWTLGASWAAETTGPQTRVDVATLLNELLEHVDYAPGAYLVLKLSGATAYQMFHAFDGAAAKAPKLTVRWSLSTADRVGIHVENLIADSAVFRAWTGAADRYEALERIHPAVADAGAAPRPFALLEPLGDLEIVEVGTNAYGPRGSQRAVFIDAIGSGEVDDDGEIAVLDKVASIGAVQAQVLGVLDDVVRLGKTPGYLNVSRAGLAEKPGMHARTGRAEDVEAGVPVDLELPAMIDFGVEAASG